MIGVEDKPSPEEAAKQREREERLNARQDLDGIVVHVMSQYMGKRVHVVSVTLLVASMHIGSLQLSRRRATLRRNDNLHSWQSCFASTTQGQMCTVRSNRGAKFKLVTRALKKCFLGRISS